MGLYGEGRNGVIWGGKEGRNGVIWGGKEGRNKETWDWAKEARDWGKEAALSIFSSFFF